MATKVTTKRKQFAEQLLKAETTLIGTSPLTSAAPDLNGRRSLSYSTRKY